MMNKLIKCSYACGFIGGGLIIAMLGNVWLSIPGLGCIVASMTGFMVDRHCRAKPVIEEAVFSFPESQTIVETPSPSRISNPSIDIPSPPVQTFPPILVGYSALIGQFTESNTDLEAYAPSLLLYADLLEEAKPAPKRK
jgi:hypothetical protein